MQRSITLFIHQKMLSKRSWNNTRPGHGFLRVEEINDSIKSGIKEKFGKFSADTVLKADGELVQSQEKVIQIVGPLLSLHKELNKVRLAEFA